MHDLKTTMHVDTLTEYRVARGNLFSRLIRVLKKEFLYPDIYGLQWGDPDLFEPLKFVRDTYVLPFVNPKHSAVEIGPGGGRWTRYLCSFGSLYVVDYHSDLLHQLKSNLSKQNMIFIKNNGTDFPGIKDSAVDFVYSFGVFVHLDTYLIEAYLDNIRRIVKPSANIILQYADKTKRMARLNDSFSENCPEVMRKLVLSKGYTIQDEDLTTLWHSSIIHLTP